MSKITSVEPQKNNPKRFNIYLDDQFAFGADEDLVVEKRLVSGKILTYSDVELLLQEAEIGKLMEKMYRLFSFRPRSEGEVRSYFRIKNHESQIKDKQETSNLAIESLIGKLKQKGLLNDLEFAKAWIDARRRSKQKGDRLIKLELQQKGVSREIIEEAFRQQALGNSEEDLAYQALERKSSRWQSLPKMEFKKKAYQFLGSKGFGFETISVVIEKLLQKE